MFLFLSTCHKNTSTIIAPTNVKQLPPFQSKLPSKPSGNCNKLTEITFLNVLPALENEKGDANKLTLAKKIAEKNCLSVSQIQRMMETFQFETSRLDFIIFAYSYCYDPQSYRQFSFQFTLKENKDALEEFLNQP
jgi:hypothetical protein